MLVFLSGEREIRETAEALRKHHPPATSRSCRCTRGSAPTSRARSSSRTAAARIVLATNVAETSLTVPGHQLRHRPGLRPHQPLQRRGTKVQRLPIEPDQPAPAPTSARAAAAASARASASASTPRRTSTQRAAVHRPGNPPHEPRQRHPADEVAAAGRGAGLPVPRAARLPPDPRRLPDAARAGRDRRGQRAHAARPAARPPADRPAHRPDDPRPRREEDVLRRGADHRRRPVDPGPARAADRASRRRPTRRTRSSPTSPRTSWPTSSCGATSRAAAGAARATSSASGARRTSCSTCACASGRTSRPSCAARPRRRRDAQPRAGAGARRAPGPAAAGCSRTSGCATRRGASTRGARRALRGLARVVAARRSPTW